MEIEAKLESIDGKIEEYSAKIDSLSSLITTLIHSFQQNQLPNIKTEILNKIEETFKNSSSVPDTDEMKNVFNTIREEFSTNQNDLKLKIAELDNILSKLVLTIENYNPSNDANDNSEIQKQLNNIQDILLSLSEEVSDFQQGISSDTNNINFPTEKIDTINSLITAQNVANTEFFKQVENYFVDLKNNLTSLKNTDNQQVANSMPAQNVSANIDMTEIESRFDDLNLAITSVLSAIKIIDKKYTELQSFQSVIDKLTTDVVSPILLASNEIKSFVDKTSTNFQKLNQFVEEYNHGAFLELQKEVSNINVDVNKLLNLVEEFKTNSDLSNNTISENMAKFENILNEYNDNLTELTKNATTEAITTEVKSLNDTFYLDLLNLFNSLSFDSEAEDIKDFLENILSSITVKTDENSEKLNNIMLQFKNLLNKVEGIERAQNSITDYLKPEETDELLYSFDDIQSDLAKMRLVLNDISKSISSSEVVDEISEKIRLTGEQIENVSKLLNINPENEKVADLKEKIEELNSQVYDISLRTNKLLLSNEDSTIELKNNLELFKDVFDKANPEKIYELFYELTHYFNDVNEKINNLSLSVQSSHSEFVTIKNSLIYVGEWLDNATNVLAEIRENSLSPVVQNTDTATEQKNLAYITENIKYTVINSISDLYAKINANNNEILNQIMNVKQDFQEYKQETNTRFSLLETKIDKLLELYILQQQEKQTAVTKKPRKTTKKDTKINEE